MGATETVRSDRVERAGQEGWGGEPNTYWIISYITVTVTVTSVATTISWTLLSELQLPVFCTHTSNQKLTDMKNKIKPAPKWTDMELKIKPAPDFTRGLVRPGHPETSTTNAPPRLFSSKANQSVFSLQLLNGYITQPWAELIITDVARDNQP